MFSLPYARAVFVDFEFIAEDGERPIPVCLVAKEWPSGRLHRLWRDEMGAAPPYPTEADTLFIAFYASAELGCHLALGWPMPARILDLSAEFKCLTNGLPRPAGPGLVGALTYYGCDSIGADAKKEMQALVMRGGPWSDEEKAQILDYCAGDVTSLERLMAVMGSRIDLPRAVLRGRYMVASARMEHAGVPIDVEALALLRQHWDGIKDLLIDDINGDYGVYEGRSFRSRLFEAFLIREGVPWPRLDTGRLALDDDTFRQMAKAHPIVAPLRELRHALSEMRLNDLTVGRDGRNRTVLWAFSSRTGRNQPSNTKYIFGPSRWIRELIKPSPGYGVGYVDYAQQEFAVAAALSGDQAMQEAYTSGDPYLGFARQAGAVPDNATKTTHGPQRELFKTCVLGVQYGMEYQSLAMRIGQSTIVARYLLQAHRETYPTYWRWSEATGDYAMLFGSLRTVFGWTIHVSGEVNPRMLKNFPMQAHGAEMLRIAICLATERDVEVVAPVHDAIMIHAPLNRLEADIATTRDAMAEASRAVLNGFEVRTDVKIVRYPDRYIDEAGRGMWDRIMKLIAEGAAHEQRRFGGSQAVA